MSANDTPSPYVPLIARALTRHSDAKADFQIELKGHYVLTGSDFSF